MTMYIQISRNIKTLGVPIPQTVTMFCRPIINASISLIIVSPENKDLLYQTNGTVADPNKHDSNHGNRV